MATQCVLGVAIWNFFPNMTDRGQYGDMFGAVNALFSGLAFAGLIFALLLQQQELNLQREELRLTRQELHGQTKALADQANTSLRAAKINGYGALLQANTQIMISRSGNMIGQVATTRAQELQHELETLLSEGTTSVDS